MDRRKSKRTPYYLQANIVSEENIYDGYIENVSRDGIEYLMTSEVRAPRHMVPQKIIDIHFEAPSGEELNLKCEVAWYLRIPQPEPHSDKPLHSKMLLGLKIINPSSAYMRLMEDIKEEC